jgi:nucleotide-binding universal stress UspA family protein
MEPGHGKGRDMVGESPTRILLATDGSRDAALAAKAAMDLASRSGADLHVVHVWQELPRRTYPTPNAASFARIHAKEAQLLLQRQAEKMEHDGAWVAEAHMRRGRPAEKIAELAGELDAGPIVVGSRGLSPIRCLMAGSVSEGVVRRAGCPVLVVRGGEEAWPPARVVVGDDGSEEAGMAARMGKAVGDLLGTSTLLVHVYAGLPHNPQLLPREELMLYEEVVADDLSRANKAMKERAAGLADAAGETPEFRVVSGDTAPALLGIAAEDETPSLVVVGSRGQGAALRVLLGSTSTGALRAASGPVLICPHPREHEDGERSRSATEELTT